jgi:amidase
VSTTRDLEMTDLAGWIDGTSVYVKQSKADINGFLAQRPDGPVSSFMQIYEGGHFHPENDLFHGIAEGPETSDGDVEYLQRRLNQEHFRGAGYLLRSPNSAIRRLFAGLADELLVGMGFGGHCALE